MLAKNTFNVIKDRRLPEKAGTDVVRQADLVELVLGPLSAQMEKMRLELLKRIREVEESAEIMAGQMKRDADRQSRNEADSERE